VSILPGVTQRSTRPTLSINLSYTPEVTRVATMCAVRCATSGRYRLVTPPLRVRLAEELSGMHLFTAQATSSALGHRFNEWPVGVGVSTDADAARTTAVAEAVERYCAMCPPNPHELVRAAASSLGVLAIPTERFRSLAAFQLKRFGLTPAGLRSVIDWSYGYSLTHESTRLVPAAFVHGTLIRRPPNRFLGELLTTGISCHTSGTEAILSGLCEVLERDALAIAWHGRLAFQPLIVEDTGIASLMSQMGQRTGLDLGLFLVPTDSPFPVVVAVGDNRQSRPHVVLGCACRPDPIAASLKALQEIVQVLTALRASSIERPKRIRRLADHPALYASSEGRSLFWKAFRRRQHGLPLVSVSSNTATPELVLWAVKKLAESGREVVVTELTTPDAASAGFQVLRILVPGAVDLTADPRLGPFGSQRLAEVPVRLESRRRARPLAKLNLLPVPLA
jgi:ribosomal protein S12 methylthiotransferase accessory factor